jgi:DNA-binding CsgD family transcriptional regulator
MRPAIGKNITAMGNKVIASKYYNLSMFELEIIYLLSLGYDYTEIGKLVFLSHRTIESKVYHIRIKLSAKSNPHLVAIAIREKLMP